MTYDQLWRSLVPDYGSGEARAVARLLLQQGFGLSMADVVAGATEQLDADATARLEAMHRRLLQGEPVQYVLGQAWFCGRLYDVRPGVLIPRPETEELCRLALDALKGRRADALRLLDIGTGTGCIACTLSLALPQAHVTAWDIAPEALATARDNVRRHQATVCVERHDILTQPVDDGRQWDVVVSNPPYVCQSERETMERRVVDHEPALALFVPDADPLRFYRAIGTYARTALAPGGSLFLEVNERLAADTACLLRGQGYRDITIKKDQYGHDRFITVCN